MARGHNDFFKSPDGSEDWIVYHAKASASGACDTEHKSGAQRIGWNSDGTPNFANPAPGGEEPTAPSGE